MNSLKSAIEQVNQIVLGKPKEIQLAVACMLAGGHILIEDLPGMGKTTLSHSLASSLGLSYKRIQFTSDMLPADIIGVSIFDQTAQQFSFHQGPLFSQIVLADEINRASPKTQSALLEAMEEGQVSIEGDTLVLPHPFFVIATQNPLHHSGTFALPESQLDRFLMRISLGYPDRDAEMSLLGQAGHRPKWREIDAFLDADTVIELQEAVLQVATSEPLLDYIYRLLNASRMNTSGMQPLSPRAGQGLVLAAKAWAFLQQREYVLPEDVQAVFVAVTQHRLQSDSVSGTDEQALSILASVDPVTDAQLA